MFLAQDVQLTQTQSKWKEMAAAILLSDRVISEAAGEGRDNLAQDNLEQTERRHSGNEEEIAHRSAARRKITQGKWADALMVLKETPRIFQGCLCLVSSSIKNLPHHLPFQTQASELDTCLRDWAGGLP